MKKFSMVEVLEQLFNNDGIRKRSESDALHNKLFSDKIFKEMIKRFELTSSKLEKHGCVRISYKTTKTSYSVFLRETKQ